MLKLTLIRSPAHVGIDGVLHGGYQPGAGDPCQVLNTPEAAMSRVRPEKFVHVVYRTRRHDAMLE